MCITAYYCDVYPSEQHEWDNGNINLFTFYLNIEEKKNENTIENETKTNVLLNS